MAKACRASHSAASLGLFSSAWELGMLGPLAGEVLHVFFKRRICDVQKHIENPGFNFMSGPFMNLMQGVTKNKDLTLQNSTSNGFSKKTNDYISWRKTSKSQFQF